MYIPFDSWNKEYKSVFGAVKCGTDIKLRILVQRELSAKGATLEMFDGNGNAEYCGMFWAGEADGGYEWWDVTYTPKKEGVYFYRFIISTMYGEKFINRKSSNKGEVSDFRGYCFQQTVYQSDFKTPDFLKGGLIYQIFPDRFAKSGDFPKDIPDGRVLRKDWGGEPYFKPNEKNIVLNNDYFGGNLQGIIEKLPYLKSLSVTCIYLNPIFEAHSNHRYDTADYEKIDALLGTKEDFEELCKEAKKLGISVILDGVFSHTGADSKYFNKYGRYENTGAYNDENSPYHDWYKWENWPDKYKSWWGIEILPELIEENPDFIAYISGEGGILEKWQKCGASGYRLDVADELPDEFLDALRIAVKNQDENAVIIGEVWEDASTKESYGQKRRYLLGKQLDTVMNYPFCNAIISFVRNGNAKNLNDTVMRLLENYPKPSVDLLMNHIGTHDTERILTLLGGEPANGRDRYWQSGRKMSETEYALAKQRLKLASAIQFFLPGVPSLYYGDEAGLQGYRDPFNRACYPWGNEDADLLNWYTTLGKIRKENKCLVSGNYQSLCAGGDLYIFIREDENGLLLCGINRSFERKFHFIGEDFEFSNLHFGKLPQNGLLELAPMSVTILSGKSIG